MSDPTRIVYLEDLEGPTKAPAQPAEDAPASAKPAAAATVSVSTSRPGTWGVYICNCEFVIRTVYRLRRAVGICPRVMIDIY